MGQSRFLQKENAVKVAIQRDNSLSNTGNVSSTFGSAHDNTTVDKPAAWFSNVKQAVGMKLDGQS